MAKYISDACIAHFGSDNGKHGDTAPLEPLKSWAKIAPPAARYVDNKQSKFAPKAPVKPSIKYFLANYTGGRNPMEINPSKISAMNTSSTDSESEIYDKALKSCIVHSS